MPSPARIEFLQSAADTKLIDVRTLILQGFGLGNGSPSIEVLGMLTAANDDTTGAMLYRTDDDRYRTSGLTMIKPFVDFENSQFGFIFTNPKGEKLEDSPTMSYGVGTDTRFIAEQVRSELVPFVSFTDRSALERRIAEIHQKQTLAMA